VLRRLAARDPQRYPLLLDSAATGPLSHASVLLASPSSALWLDREGRVGSQGIGLQGEGFLTALEHWWRSESLPAAEGEGGAGLVSGGWALFLGYELAGEVEPNLVLPATPLPWQAFALRTHGAIVLDLKTARVSAVAEDAATLARLIGDALAAAQESEATEDLRIESVREEDPAAYLSRVHRAKEYVRAGDIYQANLSRPWDVVLRAPREPGARLGSSGAGVAAALYQRLCAANPAPFAALAQWRGISILSSSPERLVRVDGRRVDTRPIAGTRPRSRDPTRERGEMSELAAHPKERAEHIMLIDLERNDLGRVCEPGTVRVDELMTIESYPGGTITGCPKFRCMQIIAELEGEGRGAYTGSLGYLTRDGRLDLNILIRTMTLRGRELSFRAGAGIVADSDPERELEETRAKARGLIAALGEGR
jgi:anthranilate synthase component I